MSNWVRAAEAALSGHNDDEANVEVVAKFPPQILDADGVRALVSPFLAAFMWAAAVFRDTQAHHTLDPLALLFRLLALALSVRAVVLLVRLLQRVRVRLQMSRYALALTPEGVLFRSPNTDIAIPREDVLDVRERGGDWGKRSGRRWAEVYVITNPDSGRMCVTLPPIFERTPGMLVESLMRWRGAAQATPDTDAGDAPTAEESAAREPLASKLWERVAAGERIPGVAAIRHGQAWLKRGPYASVLLGLAVLDGYVRLPASARVQVNTGPALLLAAALVLVPTSWFVMTRRSLAPRKGLALVLTPRELLARTRAGVQRVAWAQVTRIDISARMVWSILQGAHETRLLTIGQEREANIQCSEAFLGIPAEVVAGLCEAYRKGLVRG